MLTELSIQCALFRDMSKGYELLMPNYTPLRWWECDMFAIPKAGFWVEHEIKITVADFKNDALKSKDGLPEWRLGAIKARPAGRKHDLIGTEHGPSRFWYVMPEAVASKIALPAWAGLKIVEADYNDHVWIRETVKAPKLHTVKVHPDVVAHVQSVSYWRFWTQGKCNDHKCPVGNYIRANLNALKLEHPDGIW